MRIDKFLSLKGLCTRSNTKVFLKKNIVLVENLRLTKATQKIAIGNIVKINEIEYLYQEYVYYLLNKPKDYVSATKDDLHKTVIDLIKDVDFQTDLFCVGRLDIDTTGILLITNDGKFSHNLLSPKKHVDKVYQVELAENITDSMISELKKGVLINENYLTMTARVQVTCEKKILLTIKEGKYHQVKLMLQAVGNEVIKLNRISFGEYNLPNDLKQGSYIKI